MMKLFKLAPIAFLCLVLILGACSSETANSEGPDSDFPKKDIELIIPYGEGGGTDQVGRMLAGIASDSTGNDIVSINMPGSGGALGFEEVSNATPDGYNIVLVATNIVTNKLVGISDINYKDLEPIIGVNFDSPGLFVRSDSPWDTAEEFIEHAKNNKVNVATGSAGGLWHMATLNLAEKANLNLAIVPGAKGGGNAATQLMGEHVEAIIVPPNEATQVLSGDFNMLGIMSEEKLKNFPDVPTFQEIGYDINIASYRGFMAPKGTPEDAINYLHDMFKEAMEDEKYVNYMDDQLSNIVYKDPEGLNNLWKDIEERYSTIIDDLDLSEK